MTRVVSTEHKNFITLTQELHTELEAITSHIVAILTQLAIADLESNPNKQEYIQENYRKPLRDTIDRIIETNILVAILERHSQRFLGSLGGFPDVPDILVYNRIVSSVFRGHAGQQLTIWDTLEYTAWCSKAIAADIFRTKAILEISTEEEVSIRDTLKSIEENSIKLLEILKDVERPKTRP